MGTGEDVDNDERPHQPPERVIRIDVYHHFDDPVTVTLSAEIAAAVQGAIAVTIEEPTPPPQVPTRLKLTPGKPVSIPKEPPPMPDFILEDDQEVACELTVLDKIGNIVAGAQLDAGSVTATPADTTTVTATVSPDQSTVTLAAVGPETTDNVVSLAGTLNGEALTGSIAIDVVASAPASIGVVPGTPSTIPGEA